ncbi:MAG: prolipoprotein diacylglyceryl transferase [Candidatus Thiodiazotropha sp. (ex Lucinoma kastoroae)]|nr:prolipoprotein diacylglyceryl transferase [Candidatus Thiodiazotropha sp. (ex Rostrolucina anterorostrata)]MCU7848533.1 prolipoprotein diacylglyceryl transferase [Candidatus Thiodiazotropha sp. (ex Lucinoma kastoroae)]
MTHALFDLLALIAAVGLGRWFRKHHGLVRPTGIRDQELHHYYLFWLLMGLTLGSVLFGSWNLWLSGSAGLAKSILGGLFGAIIAAESFKRLNGIRRSTGLYFVPGLAALIVVGRIGCFFGGLEDYTYGIATAMPWGVNFGDDVPRHPVQLYESLVMLLFLIFLFFDYPRRPLVWQQQGFYWFVLVYAVQRFAWEFIKPYPAVLFDLTLFHWLCMALAAYSLWMLKAGSKHGE